MTEPHRPRVKYVIGPDSSPLTISDLPAPGTKRWVIRRKAEVVAAVRGGLQSLYADGRRVSCLAILDRPPWPRWSAYDADPAVPAIAAPLPSVAKTPAV